MTTLTGRLLRNPGATVRPSRQALMRAAVNQPRPPLPTRTRPPAGAGLDMLVRLGFVTLPMLQRMAGPGGLRPRGVSFHG